MRSAIISTLLLVTTGIGSPENQHPQPHLETNIAISSALPDTTDTTLVLGNGVVISPSERAQYVAPYTIAEDTLSIIRPTPIPQVDGSRRPNVNCRLDAVDPDMVHEPDTSVVASIGVVPPTTRFEPRIRVLRPCPELSEWRSVQPAR